VRVLPVVVARLVLATAVEFGQVLARGGLDAALPGQLREERLIPLSGVAADDAAQRRVGFEGRAVDADRLAVNQIVVGQEFKDLLEDRRMGLDIDQAARAADRRVVRRRLVERDAQEELQGQAVVASPVEPRSESMPSK
jgi:hypothetical protein